VVFDAGEREYLEVPTGDAGMNADEAVRCGCKLGGPWWCCPERNRAAACPSERSPRLLRDHSYDRNSGCYAMLGSEWLGAVVFFADSNEDRWLGQSCGCVFEGTFGCCPPGHKWPEEIMTACPQ
jgi:hypothetical protein